MSWEKNYLNEVYGWRFGGKKNISKIPQRAIIGLGGSASKIASFLKNKIKLGPSFVGTYKGEKIAVLACGMGAAEIETTMGAISKLPIEYLIAIGWVGAIDPKIKIGDLILPTIALRGENTTDYYLPRGINISPNKTLNYKLEQNLIRKKIKYFKGRVFTTPAPFKETPQFINILQENKIIGVEMECSVLFTLSKLQRKRASALLVVSDNPSTFDTHALNNNLEKKEEKGFERAVNIVLESMIENSLSSVTKKWSKAKKEALVKSKD